jgi:hypothetical protein
VRLHFDSLRCCAHESQRAIDAAFFLRLAARPAFTRAPAQGEGFVWDYVRVSFFPNNTAVFFASDVGLTDFAPVYEEQTLCSVATRSASGALRLFATPASAPLWTFADITGALLSGRAVRWVNMAPAAPAEPVTTGGGAVTPIELFRGGRFTKVLPLGAVTSVRCCVGKLESLSRATASLRIVPFVLAQLKEQVADGARSMARAEQVPFFGFSSHLLVKEGEARFVRQVLETKVFANSSVLVRQHVLDALNYSLLAAAQYPLPVANGTAQGMAFFAL